MSKSSQAKAGGEAVGSTAHTERAAVEIRGLKRTHFHPMFLQRGATKEIGVTHAL